MSDHPKEADRNLKRIFICDDIYLDVFLLLTPSNVGLELAIVSDRFDALVDTHFKYRKWTLGKLRIWSQDIDKLNNNWATKKTLQFPPKPLPNSIVGFSSIFINSTNSADAIAFLRCIARLLESDVSLGLFIRSESSWNTFATSFWPLLNMSAIIKLHFQSLCGFQHFRRLISPTILCDCTNLRMIISYYGNVVQFPPDDSNGSSAGQAKCKWLHTPRADGQPKVVKCWRDGNEIPMDAFKTFFLNATTSVSFIIRLRPAFFSPVVPFKLVNALTREQLTIQPIFDGPWWLIERSPINKDAKQWAKWEKEALEDDWKVLGMCLLNDDV